MKQGELQDELRLLVCSMGNSRTVIQDVHDRIQIRIQIRQSHFDR